jgi:hypothetical protein
MNETRDGVGSSEKAASGVRRRDLIRAVGASVTGLPVATTADVAVARGQASVTFRDQTTDGMSVTVARISTDVDVTYSV